MKELVQKIITLKVNGKDYDITVGTGRNDMPESETLAHTLRDRLGLTGLKIGCGSLRLLYRDYGRKGSYVMHDIDYGL